MATATKKAAPAKRKPSANREVIPGLENVIAPAFAPALSFDEIGTVYAGSVVKAQSVHARDYQENKLKFWPSGDPMMILVVTLEIGDGNGNYEERTLWVQGAAMTKAFRAALRDAGLNGIAIGDVIQVEHTGTEPVLDKNGKPLKDERKLYSVEITPV